MLYHVKWAEPAQQKCCFSRVNVIYFLERFLQKLVQVFYIGNVNNISRHCKNIGNSLLICSTAGPKIVTKWTKNIHSSPSGIVNVKIGDLQISGGSSLFYFKLAIS